MMFIDKWLHAQGSITLVSHEDAEGEILDHFDCYYKSNGSAIKYFGMLSPKRHDAVQQRFERMAREWRAIPTGQIPTEAGYVAGDMLLAASRVNPESWSLYIQLANKPDVSLEVRSFVVGAVKPDQTLRKRAGGILVGMLGMAAGLHRLRNRERQARPIHWPSHNSTSRWK